MDRGQRHLRADNQRLRDGRLHEHDCIRHRLRPRRGQNIPDLHPRGERRRRGREDGRHNLHGRALARRDDERQRIRSCFGRCYCFACRRRFLLAHGELHDFRQRRHRGHDLGSACRSDDSGKRGGCGTPRRSAQRHKCHGGHHDHRRDRGRKLRASRIERRDADAPEPLRPRREEDLGRHGGRPCLRRRQLDSRRRADRLRPHPLRRQFLQCPLHLGRRRDTRRRIMGADLGLYRHGRDPDHLRRGHLPRPRHRGRLHGLGRHAHPDEERGCPGLPPLPDRRW